MQTETIAPPVFSHPMHEALFWRGVFIHRYGGVEHVITELLLRAGGRDEYNELGRLPFSWPGRLKLLQKIIDADGPLHGYAQEIRVALKPFLALERVRNIMTHGMMATANTMEPRNVVFRGFEFVDGEVGETSLHLTVDQVIGYAEAIGEASRPLIPLVTRIFSEQALEPIDVQTRVELQPKRTSI